MPDGPIRCPPDAVATRADGERIAVEGDVEDVLAHSEGVGLWLVRLVVEKADGQLSVASSSLGGVTVTLSVPRADGGS